MDFASGLLGQNLIFLLIYIALRPIVCNMQFALYLILLFLCAVQLPWIKTMECPTLHHTCDDCDGNIADFETVCTLGKVLCRHCAGCYSNPKFVSERLGKVIAELKAVKEKQMELDMECHILHDQYE